MGDEVPRRVNGPGRRDPPTLTGINRRRTRAGLEWRLAQEPTTQ
jgi:hypothetical protein